MATSGGYWYVREHVGSGLYHLIEASAVSTAWQAQPRAEALCGYWVVREDNRFDARYDVDMIGEPTCHACYRRAA